MIHIKLDWPPSVNTYWRSPPGQRPLISRAGRTYRQLVWLAIQQQRPGIKYNEGERLSLSIVAYPPDRRIRDLDNMLKAPLDALVACGVIGDDSQIDKLSIERDAVINGGALHVYISQLGEK